MVIEGKFCFYRLITQVTFHFGGNLAHLWNSTVNDP